MFWMMLSACLPHVPQVSHPVSTGASSPSTQLLEQAGPIELQTIVSARWAVPLRGLLDLDHPEAVAAGMENVSWPIVLPVHVLRHPQHGAFVIDTGVDAAIAAGERGSARGVVRGLLKELEPERSLASILEAEADPITAVLLTHTHLDHVLGLPDVPAGVPVIAGPGELQERGLVAALMRSTYRSLFEGVTLSVLDPDDAVALGGLEHAWDLLGDGSLWALSTPGHTPGSLSFLARTTEGPVLFVGDTSHTRWGWDHGVPPGTYTEDGPGNAESLDRLRELVAIHPRIRVEVGHELGPQDAPQLRSEAAGEEALHDGVL